MGMYCSVVIVRILSQSCYGLFAFLFSQEFSQSTPNIGCLPRWLTWMTNFPAALPTDFFCFVLFWVLFASLLKILDRHPSSHACMSSQIIGSDKRPVISMFGIFSEVLRARWYNGIDICFPQRKDCCSLLQIG